MEEFSESIFFHLVHFFTREWKKRGEEEKRVEGEREGMGEGEERKEGVGGGHGLTEWDGESTQPTLGLRMCEMFTLCLSIGKWGPSMCVIKERTCHSLKYLKR